MKRLQQFVAPAFGGIAALTPVAALAQGSTVGTGGTTTVCAFVNNIFSLVGVFGTILLVLALIVLLYAAFLFITGGGNEETTKKARSLLIYSLIGLAIAFLAIFADDIITQLFGNVGKFLNQCGTAVLQ